MTINMDLKSESQASTDKAQRTCEVAAIRAVTEIMIQNRQKIKNERLKKKIIGVVEAYLKRYEEFKADWIASAGSLRNRSNGKTFLKNFVDGAVIAAQNRILQHPDS